MKGFQGQSEKNIDKTKSQGSHGSFAGHSEKNLDKPTSKVAGSSAAAAPCYPAVSKKEGGGKGSY